MRSKATSTSSGPEAPAPGQSSVLRVSEVLDVAIRRVGVVKVDHDVTRVGVDKVSRQRIPIPVLRTLFMGRELTVCQHVLPIFGPGQRRFIDSVSHQAPCDPCDPLPGLGRDRMQPAFEVSLERRNVGEEAGLIDCHRQPHFDAHLSRGQRHRIDRGVDPVRRHAVLLERTCHHHAQQLRAKFELGCGLWPGVAERSG